LLDPLFGIRADAQADRGQAVSRYVRALKLRDAPALAGMYAR
jgi:hypothetical protein